MRAARPGGRDPCIADRGDARRHSHARGGAAATRAPYPGAEDNPVNQRVAQGLLARRGHDVTVVANGRLAVDAVQHEAFDLVLMDVHMPDLDGFEATAAIRAPRRAPAATSASSR